MSKQILNAHIKISTKPKAHELKNAQKTSRRKFFRIGAISLSAILMGKGMVRHLLLPVPKKETNFQYPTRNPAFKCQSDSEGNLICYTNNKQTNRKMLYRLNPVGRDIFVLCDGKHNFTDIVDRVASTFNLDHEKLIIDARQFISILDRMNLMLNNRKINLFDRRVVRYAKS